EPLRDRRQDLGHSLGRHVRHWSQRQDRQTRCQETFRRQLPDPDDIMREPERAALARERLLVDPGSSGPSAPGSSSPPVVQTGTRCRRRNKVLYQWARSGSVRSRPARISAWTIRGCGPPIDMTLSASAVTVETFESITSTWLGSGKGMPRKSSHA